jgi:C-terminal binding protein
LIGERELRLLPKDAVVVNTARGPILDIDALERVLRDGHVAAAGLDVIPVEPPVEPVPSLLQAYRNKEEWLTGRLIITPHIAGRSPEAVLATAALVVANLQAHFAGGPVLTPVG